MTDTFRFIVIADSHIRPPDQEVAQYPSNAQMVKRNDFIVDLANEIDAAFVVHLGDIVHPLPVERTHVDAIGLAKKVYAGLRHPIHFVPGNHDVGDKPNALVAVPAVAEENYRVYEDAWGPSFHSFDHEDCHFVIIDTQIMNSGLEREAKQRMWLESDLQSATTRGRRIFLLTHYPPFIRDRSENEHYDNIGEPARSWLLDLIELHRVEAVFSGHVHNFLYNRHLDTDMYVAPSTAFVRPDYAELSSVAPSAENGRDDPPKLGIFVVDVSADGHHVTPIRSCGSTRDAPSLPLALSVALALGWESPLGVSLRHGWAETTAFPTSGLDAFNRKEVRNDAPLLALWEGRIRAVRVPLADLRRPSVADRMRQLTEGGLRFDVVSAGIPDPTSIQTVRANAGSINRWEIAAPLDLMEDVLLAVEDAQLNRIGLAIAPIVPIDAPGAAVHHFVAAGFGLQNDPLLTRWVEIDTSAQFASLVFRIPWHDPIGDSIDQARMLTEGVGRRAVVIVELPRAGEGTTFADDAVVERRVVDAVRAAARQPAVDVFLDGFMDHDRGYYPRHGLIDRAFNPRRALYGLIEESATTHSS